MEQPDRYRLLETTPAEDFSDTHLLGNGAIGASVYGGIPYEKILINHDTLWSGQEDPKISRNTLPNFEKARRLVLEGRLKEATTLINEEMLGYWSESYLPLGYLNITLNLKEDLRTMTQKRILEGEFPVENYSRELALDRAVETVAYNHLGRHYTRTMFVSYPDNVIAVRLTARGGSLDFALSMDSPLRHEQVLGDGAASILGRAPDRVEPYGPRYTPNVVYRPDTESDALRFAATAVIAETDGEVRRDNMRVYVTGATYAVILSGAGTNFGGVGLPRDRDAQKVLSACGETVARAAKKGWDRLLGDHIADYQSLYGRVSIDLGPEITGSLPTTQRMEQFRDLEDPGFIALIAQYCRYLLITFSRPGTQAGNLQGIWNPLVYPSWACNYTTNINVQMNYWCAEAFGLSECHLPMSDLVRECAESGKTAARELYGLPGWVTHHNTDLWRFSALAGEDASWAWWPFGGFWMCQHLWEHYAYTQDRDYLEGTVYPVLLEAARFLCAFVVKDENGFYVTAPSTSPENKFFLPGTSAQDHPDQVQAGNRMSPNRPDTAEVAKAATMDLAIIRELLGNLQRAAAVLGRKDPLLERVDEVLEHLMPFKVGKYGQLQEWDEDYDECTPGMSHMSHLYPVYPGDQITEETEPALYRAAYAAFSRRMQHGNEAQGWPGAWQICLRARFGEGEAANLLNKTMPRNLGANLLTRGSLQIDAIMGWGAGIAEMLLQSHQEAIQLLPAIPLSWRQGKVRGMRARGGYTVDMSWEKGDLVSATVTAARDGDCVISYRGKRLSLSCKQGQPVTLTADRF